MVQAVVGAAAAWNACGVLSEQHANSVLQLLYLIPTGMSDLADVMGDAPHDELRDSLRDSGASHLTWATSPGPRDELRDSGASNLTWATNVTGLSHSQPAAEHAWYGSQ